jgi:hypothetical protein
LSRKVSTSKLNEIFIKNREELIFFEITLLLCTVASALWCMAFNDFWAMPSFWQRWTNDRVSDCVHSENSNPFSFTKVQRKVIGIHSQKTRPEWLVRLSEAARQEAGNYIMRENTVHGSYKPAAE